MNKELVDNVKKLVDQSEKNGYCKALIDIKNHIERQIIKITLNNPDIPDRIKKSQDYLEVKQFITSIAEVKYINLN